MPASGKRSSHRSMALLAWLLYRAGLLGIWLSGMPVIGGLMVRIFRGRYLKVVTVPVDVKLRSEYSILPFDAVRSLVESSAYIAGLPVCICRESRGCEDYPVDIGCLFLGEGARTIRYRGAREFTKDEALDRLERAKKLGLVSNIIHWGNEMKLLGVDEKRTVELCSCCPCCCLMFKTRDGARAFMDSFQGFGVCKVVKADGCTHCTNCERSCPFRAIRVSRQGEPSIDESVCKGCGRCELACKHEVLKVFPSAQPQASMHKIDAHAPDTGNDLDRLLAMVR